MRWRSTWLVLLVGACAPTTPRGEVPEPDVSAPAPGSAEPQADEQPAPKDAPHEEPEPCGGIGGGRCPKGQRCVDDPSDQCVMNSDRDCMGICQPATPP